MTEELEFQPLTPGHWDDLERLFGPRGAYSGCWCMWWRQTRAEFSRRGNKGNRAAFKSLVDSGQHLGVLGYQQGAPVGWCSIAPRPTYPSLQRSPVLRPIDEQPVWSLVCLFIHKDHRRRGLARRMLQGAIHYADSNGGAIVEAYPTVSDKEDELPPVSSFMGTPALFESAGFVRVATPSKSRAIYRYYIHASSVS